MSALDGVKIGVLVGSIRSGSFNQKLADAYIADLAERNCQISNFYLKDYDLPIYDADLEANKGIPKNAINLARQLAIQDGLLVITPEYNGSLSPLLKNTIDWLSRVREVDGKALSVFSDKACAVAAASPGRMGGYVAASHLCDIMARLGSLVISEMFALPYAERAFDDEGRLSEDGAKAMLERASISLVEKARLLA